MQGFHFFLLQSTRFDPNILTEKSTQNQTICTTKVIIYLFSNLSKYYTKLNTIRGKSFFKSQTMTFLFKSQTRGFKWTKLPSHTFVNKRKLNGTSRIRQSFCFLVSATYILLMSAGNIMIYFPRVIQIPLLI